MKPLERWSLLLGVLLLSTGVLGSASAKDGKSLYRLKPVLMKEGDGTVKAALQVEATQGYKWNKEFPCKLVIEKQSGLTLGKQKYVKGDVKLSNGGQTATFDLGSAGRTGPGALIQGKASFSLCTKKVCKIFMNKDVTWKAED